MIKKKFERKSWESRNYCPLRLKVEDRPEDCGRHIEEGGIECSFCELYERYFQIKGKKK